MTKPEEGNPQGANSGGNPRTGTGYLRMGQVRSEARGGVRLALDPI